MTLWADADRVAKIQRLLKDVRHDIAIIERILGHLELSGSSSTHTAGFIP